MKTTPWQTHPRPQLKRKAYRLLNGSWKLNQQPVLVPYPPQSALSAYSPDVTEQLTYEYTFLYPEDFTQTRTLLHFGAVDQIAEVWLNDKHLGRHEGGYLPFTFDITDSVRKEEENHLRVEVTDSLDPTYPYGKQSKKPGSMWYTPVSGIWQSVWLENVPELYIKSIKLDVDLRGVDITVEGISDGFTAETDGQSYHFDGNSGRIEIQNPILWTPDNPHLYPLTISAGEDTVKSYFALRTVAIEKKSGVNRILLNGQPIFLHGVLDQGYFPDGIFLPAEPEEYDRDILRMKELGMNLLRKHVKIEPEYFYCACDRLGILLMQDMVNSGSYHFIRDSVLPTLGFRSRPDTLGPSLDKRKEFFRRHMLDTLRHLHNHPSVIAYTLFNEGWGQFQSDSLYELAKSTDPSRLIDSTSGWFAQNNSDFDSEHIYFRLKKLSYREQPLLVSECGGYTLPVPGHLYSDKRQYGYGTCENSKELTDKILEMYQKMIFPAIQDGCCGCIYTQLSDVEEEINGLYTYDRQVCKVDKERLRILSNELRYIVNSL